MYVKGSSAPALATLRAGVAWVSFLGGVEAGVQSREAIPCLNSRHHAAICLHLGGARVMMAS